MSWLLASLVLFLASHAVPALPALRGRLVGLMGERSYLAAYGLLSLAMVAPIGLAYAMAERQPLWETQAWMRHLALAVMLPACFFLIVSLSTPNPYSVGIGARGFDPTRPGVLRLCKHPLLVSLALWAAAHLLVNGDDISALMFGFFLVLALAGFPMMKAKRKFPPFDQGRLTLSDIGIWRIGLALLLYALLLWAHPYAIGVDPLSG